MFKKFYFLFLAIVASISLGVVAANAAPVTFFNSLGSTYTGTYDMYGSAVANGTWPNAYAGGFTALSSGSVTEIDLEITSRFAAGAGYSGDFTVGVYSNLANPPLFSSEQTASAVYTYPVPAGYNPLTDLQSISVSGLNLTAGQSYFVVVTASESNSDIDWFASSSTIGTTEQLLGGGAWSLYSTEADEPAFKIIGETLPPPPPPSVPEPTTMLLLGFGLVGLAGVRRKFKK